MNSKKRKMVSVLAIVLVLAMVIGTIAPFAQVIFGAPMSAEVTQVMDGSSSEETGEETPVSSVIDNNRFEVSAKIGFNGEYIVGKETPININVKNNGEDFKGELAIKVYFQIKNESYGEAGKYILYYQDIDIAKGAIKEYNFDSALSTVNTSIEISLNDKKGDVVYRNNFPVKALSPDTIGTAVLTDTPSGMNYIQGLDLHTDNILDYTTPEKIFFFTKDNFPQSTSVLESFKNIIITDFDTKSLNENQINAVTEWVENGGNIVFGTGQNEMRSLSAFSEIFGITASNPSEKTFGAYPELSGMYTCDIKGEGLNVIVDDNGIPLFYIKNQGGGKVITATFDLALYPFSGYLDSNNIIKMAFENSGIKFQSGNLDEGYSYSSNNDVAKSVPLKDKVKLNIIFAIVIVYILIIGPILYVILKRKDKREFGWVLIPACAFIVTVIIFVLGSTSYYNKGILGVVSSVEIQNGSSYGKAEMSINAKSPDAGSVSVELSENLPIKPDSTKYYRYSNEDICVAKINVGENRKISYLETEKWSDNTVETEKNVNLGGNISFDAKINEDKLIITVDNKTSHNFEDAIVVMDTLSFRLDNIPSGEITTKEFSLENDSTISDRHNYRNGLDIYMGINDGYMELRNGADSGLYSDSEVFEINKRATLLEQAMSESYTRNINENVQGMSISLYMFDDENILKTGTLINGKYPQNVVSNIYYIDNVIKYSDMENYDIPFGIIKPYVEDDKVKGDVDYSTENNYISAYGDDGSISEVPMVFVIPDVLTLKSFEISSYGDSNVKEEIYNIKTQSYEPLKTGEITDFSSYINENNEIRIKNYYPSNYMEFSMPGISIKGGVK